MRFLIDLARPVLHSRVAAIALAVGFCAVGMYQTIFTGVMYAEYETYVSTPLKQLEAVIFDPESYPQWLELPDIEGELVIQQNREDGSFACSIGGKPWECHFASGSHRASIATLSMASPEGELRRANFEVWPVNDGEFSGVHIYLLQNASPYERSFGAPAFNERLRNTLMKNYHSLTERAAQ